MNGKRNGQWIPWGVIVVAFLFMPPLGAGLMLWKLFSRDRVEADREPSLREEPRVTVDTRINKPPRTQAAGRAEEAVRQASKSPAPKKSNTRRLRTIGIVLALIGLVMFTDEPDSVGEFLSALAFFAGGAGMVLKGWLLDRDRKRYATYLAMIGDREAVPVEELARKSGRSKKQVERDLREMAENGFFGEGAYLNMELGYYFRNSQADREWQERQRAAQASAPREAEEGYSGILRNIRRANDAIADPVLSAKIDQLESLTARIFRVVEQNPEKASRIDTFLNYYLPTTQKLLDSYAQFEAAGVEGENLTQAKERIASTMDMILKGFSHQLDELYKADAMDVDSDIRVMESMLRRDTASAADDFGLKNTRRGSVAEDFGLGRGVSGTGTGSSGTSGAAGGSSFPASGGTGASGTGSVTSGTGNGPAGTTGGASGTTGGKPRPKIGTSFEDDFGLGGAAAQREEP